MGILFVKSIITMILSLLGKICSLITWLDVPVSNWCIIHDGVYSSSVVKKKPWNYKINDMFFLLFTETHYSSYCFYLSLQVNLFPISEIEDLLLSYYVLRLRWFQNKGIKNILCHSGGVSGVNICTLLLYIIQTTRN